MPELVHDGDAHLAHQFVSRSVCPLQGTAKNRDLIGQNHRVSVSALGEGDAFVQAEEHRGIAPVAAELRFSRPVFDDDLDVVEHLQYVVRQPVQGVGDQPFELPLTMSLDAMLRRSTHTELYHFPR